MDKICLIRQPAGLGDILYTQKIYKDLVSKGYEVVWPVIDEFLWLNDYLDTKFISINSDFPLKEYYNQFYVFNYNNGDLKFIPLQDADRLISGERIMASKYKLYGIESSDWSNYLKFNRNHKKEDKLFYETLGLKDGEEYCLTLRNYGSPPNFLKFPINYVGNLKIVELDFYEGFTLFDWCKVIENASEMHLIDSSINYIIDLLTLKSDRLFLYTRRPNNFSEIDYIFKTKYTFVR